MEIVMLDNLGAIEQRVYRTYWNDGLLDLFAAVGVLGVGISWMLDFPVGGAIMPALLVPLWGPCRQRFIEPRLGLVEFSDARQQRNSNLVKQVVLLGFGFFALGVALYVLRGRIDLDPAVNLVAGLPAALLGLLAVMAAFLVSLARFLIYAALLVIAGVVGALLGWEPGLILTEAGAGMFVIALAVLVGFLRNHPVSDGTPE